MTIEFPRLCRVPDLAENVDDCMTASGAQGVVVGASQTVRHRFDYTCLALDYTSSISASPSEPDRAGELIAQVLAR